MTQKEMYHCLAPQFGCAACLRDRAVNKFCEAEGKPHFSLALV